MSDHDADWNGDYLRARDKIESGRRWRGRANIPVGDEQMTFGFRLLEEGELLEIREMLPDGGASGEYDDEELQEVHERLLELQSKEHLTETEEEELKRLNELIQENMGDVQSELGPETIRKLMELGKAVIRPTEDDVRDLIDAPIKVQERIFDGGVPQHLNESKAKDALTRDMQGMVDAQPYPIKLNIGLQSLNETVTVVGNGH